MENKLYLCNKSRFHSYLATQIVSFVEYKVNVGGCVPESFLPVMQRFDAHCCQHTETVPCLKQETVLNFLDIGKIRNSTARRVAFVIRSFGKYLVTVLRLDDVYVVPTLIRGSGKTFVPYVFNHDEIAALFNEPEQAKAYFQKIREDKPRYIRDQLHTIKKLNGDFDMEIANQALMFCVENKIYRATDMVSVAKSIEVRLSQDDTIKQPIVIKTINQTAQKIIPEKSNISDYQSLMN